MLNNMGTNKRGLIVYGGESSADFGMVVAEAPTFERASRKQTVYKIPGRNGSVIIQQNAWEDVGRSYRVWFTENKNRNLVEYVDAVMAWLNSVDGYARLEDSFEPDVFRLAYYSGGNDVDNILMQAGEATLRFTCRAERFLKEGEQTIIVSDGSKIYNPTRFESKPLVHIEGDGEIMLSIGGARIMATVDEYINIDSDTMNAYKEPTNNENDKITGFFPTIKPGENEISITGDFTEASIVPRYFTI